MQRRIQKESRRAGKGGCYEKIIVSGATGRYHNRKNTSGGASVFP
jgi:hypothetical protein